MQPDINSILQQQQGVGSAIQQESEIPSLLRQALTEKFQRSPVFGQRQRAVEDLLAAPAEARAEFARPRNVTIGGGQAVAPGQNPVGEQSTVENLYLSPCEKAASAL